MRAASDGALIKFMEHHLHYRNPSSMHHIGGGKNDFGSYQWTGVMHAALTDHMHAFMICACMLGHMAWQVGTHGVLSAPDNHNIRAKAGHPTWCMHG